MSDNLTLDNTNVNQQILREYLNQKRDQLEKQYVPEARGLDFTRAIGWDNAFRYPKLDKVFETEVLEPLVAQGIIDRNSFNQLISENQRARSGWYEFGGGSDQKAAHLDLINNLQLGANANSMLNQKQFQTAVNAIAPGSGTYQNDSRDNNLSNLTKDQEYLGNTNLPKEKRIKFEEGIVRDDLQNNAFLKRHTANADLGGKTIAEQEELMGANAIKTRQLGQLIQQGQAPQNRTLDLQEKQLQNRKLANVIKGVILTGAILKGDQ